MAPGYPLHERFAGIERALPRLELTSGPTPVHPLARLTGDPAPVLWVKRDDRTSAAYGGNKPRKLELLLADARRRGSRTVLTTGAYGSNHALATCIHGRAHGFEVEVALFPQPITPHVQMSLRLFARHASRMIAGELYTELKGIIQSRSSLIPDLYYIPAGGSAPLGAIGFVNAGLELAAQIRAGEMPEPSAIIVAAGTCGTLSGLLVGLKLAGISSRLVGVRVTDAVLANRAAIVSLAEQALRILVDARANVPAVAIGSGDFDLLEDYYGPGYGHPTFDGIRAVQAMREREQIPLETTYTGKAMAAALDAVGRRTVRPEAPLLFWNTFAGPILKAEAASIPDDQVPAQFRWALAPDAADRPGADREERIALEDEMMAKARAIVDSAILKIMNVPMSRDEALELVGQVRVRVVELFPGRERVFDLVLLPRFERLLDEHTR
jgi:D-cysteine desulfhydrase